MLSAPVPMGTVVGIGPMYHHDWCAAQIFALGGAIPTQMRAASSPPRQTGGKRGVNLR